MRRRLEEAEAADAEARALAASTRRVAVAQLRESYGLSVRDTAALLQVSTGRVYQLVRRA